MRRHPSRLVAMFFLMILLATPGYTSDLDSRASYDRYLAAYSAYRDAVDRQRPASEIQGLLDTFKAAKSQYEQTFNIGSTLPAQSGTQDSIDGAAQAAQAANEPLATGATSGTASQARATLPQDLQKILTGLWSEAGIRAPDAGIAQLEKYIQGKRMSAAIAVAMYELARAYEELKGDTARSAALLKQLATSPAAGNLAGLAQERLRYQQATAQHQAWKTTLVNKYQVVSSSYEKYLGTSWLAIPVKAARWTGYVGKLLDFNGAQKDFQKFQIAYEELGGRFVPPVGIVFEVFKTATGGIDRAADVALHYSNSHSWYSRWKLLNEAKQSIDVQYFIVEKDIFGMALQGVLLRKAKEGVKIRFMMDARGTKGLTRKLMGQDFVQELSAFPNVEVRTFSPVHRNLLTAVFDVRKLLSSNHDKIIVVDNEYAIVGGRNVSMNYFVDPEDYPSAYRDTDVVIKSQPVAEQMALAFNEEFAPVKSYTILADAWGNIDAMSHELESAWDAMDSYIRGGEYFRAPNGAHKRFTKALQTYNTELAKYRQLIHYAGFDPMTRAHTAPVKIIDKHSLAGFRNDITDQLVRFIDGSRHEIILQNPYVIFTDRMFNALKRASRRGVRIYLHTNSPKSTDSLMTQAMFYSEWKKVLKEVPTCRIFTYYGDRKLHAKNFLFDGKVGIIGTYNMDPMSEQINSEIVAAIHSASFGRELRDELMSDITNSKEYQIELQADGSAKAVFGPDDLPGKNMWLMKTLAKFTFLKPLT
jgi:cardiolipin synthase C